MGWASRFVKDLGQTSSSQPHLEIIVAVKEEDIYLQLLTLNAPPCARPGLHSLDVLAGRAPHNVLESICDPLLMLTIFSWYTNVLR